jgi:hypothetical protein
MKRWLMVGLVAACGSVDNKTQDAKTADSKPVDAAVDTVDAPPAPRCDPTKPFGAPTVLANVNSTSTDSQPFLSQDELQLWFSSNRAGGQGGDDIYMATRTSKDADFGQPQTVAGVNTAGNDTRPSLTADGLNIYIQYLPTGSGATYTINSATRSSTSTAFGGPSEVTAIVSSSFDDAPMVLPDNSAIYFLSGRDGSAHIYRSVRSNNTWQAPALASGTDLNNSNNDYPTIVANDLTIYFLSSRAGGVAGTDNWKATRASAVQSFGAATNVTELNQSEGYYIYYVTNDDCIAYLAGPNGANGDDMFVAKKPL